MDGLIVILILVGILSSFSKKKKETQKRVAQARTAEPQSEAQPVKKTGQTKIPFTKEEWEAFLAEAKAQEKKPVPPPMRKAKPVSPAKAAKPARTPAPVLLLDHDEPEGTVSTQGESAAEHAGHRQRVLVEETRLREYQETLQELRHMNRQKLRQAVVMSEILGKPVSLRPRSYH